MKRVIFLIILLILIGLGIYGWSIWPGTTVMTPDMVKWRLNASVPVTNPRGDWEKRGEYLVTVAGCAMCHTPYSWIGPHGDKALQGGMRVRWKNELGERVAFNLTPDPETGLGLWTEEDFIRGMKAGLYPDGRIAHWQAMPWDMHSNWSLDDMRAIYRYLMSLKPVRQEDPTPINEPLPEPDTFYFGN